MRNPLPCICCLSGVSERASNKAKSHRSRVKAKSSLPEQLCREFSLDEIEAATYNFDSNLIIGKGGSGVVYKGFLDDGQRTLVVAVKRIQPGSSEHTEEFRNEVQLLCQLRHQHLVPLIGFCDEEDEQILVYKYMSNGSLYDYLHGSTGRDPLPWKQRLEICIGAARGLHYLHTGAKRAVIHRDIKTKNILLDDQLVSKLSDFGLSKIGPYSMSSAPLRIELPSLDEEVSTRMVGTFGYLAPEFLRANFVTDKSDVYSFGVVLFEVLCGRKVIKFDVEEDERYIISWVTKCTRNGVIYQTIDPYLKGKIAPSSLKKFLEISLCCIKPRGYERPTQGEVEATLELALDLQNKAEDERACINPHGEGMYEEILFSSPAFDFSDYVEDMLSLHESPHVDSLIHESSRVSSLTEDALSDIEDLPR
ncbi:hypothetical protein PTKIN_Ptkin15bG0181500 [Pterospermum kingtungense]